VLILDVKFHWDFNFYLSLSFWKFWPLPQFLQDVTCVYIMMSRNVGCSLNLMNHSNSIGSLMYVCVCMCVCVCTVSSIFITTGTVQKCFDYRVSERSL